MTEYMVTLLAVLALTALVDRPSFFAGLVIAWNFAANEAFVRATGWHDGWLFFSLTDGVAAVVLTSTRRDFGKVGAAISAIYATQVLMHFAYWLSPNASAYFYWQSLTSMAFVQLLILALGGLYGGGRRYRHRSGIRRIPPLHSASHSRAAKPDREP